MNATMFALIITVVCVGITGFLVWKVNNFRNTAAYKNNENKFVKFLKWEENLILKITKGGKKLLGRYAPRKIKSWLFLEIILLGIWSLWVGRDYLNFDPYMWPIGREFGVQVISHNFWNQILECGSCALWNGSINGGFPALADTFGSAYHPLVMITTLLFGIITGVKVATILSLWIMGISQWGISRLLGGRASIRIWSGALAVVGGHVLGKLELGAFGITLSISMAVLTILSVLVFIKKRNKGSMLDMACSITLLLLSGHGYFQVAILSWLAVVFLLHLIKQPAATKRKYVLAIILGLLMACVIIIPTLHFAPNIEKWADDDPSLHQKPEYIPLNLVIRDWDYYIDETLDKPPFPYLTNIYISWVPVLLAILTLALPKEEGKPYLSVLTVGGLYFFFLSTGIPFKWAVKIFPFLSGVRHTQLIAGLLAPTIIGLASYGSEQLLRMEWPALNLAYGSRQPIYAMAIQWLIIIPFVFSIYSSYQFNKAFIKLTSTHDIYQAIDEVPENNTQWFATPYSEHSWVLPSIEKDLKITDVVYPWWWKGYTHPKPYLQLALGTPHEGMVSIGEINDIPIYNNADYLYAYIDTGDSKLPCSATANGGDIEVYCRAVRSGQLIVKEHNWNGWNAWRDGYKIRIRNQEGWIMVDARGGEHFYTFRYIPWDVYLGLTLSIIGFIFSILIWRSSIPLVEDFLKGKKYMLPNE